MTFPDQRSGELLLVAHRIVNLSIAGKQRGDRRVAIEAVTEWASRQGAGVYQLPLPHYHLAGPTTGEETPDTADPADAADPGSSAAGPVTAVLDTAPDARAYDAERLEFVFGQLDIYRAGGYSVLAAVAIAEDLDHPCETVWWDLFAEVARTHGWEQLRVLSVDLDAGEFTGGTWSGSEAEPS